MPHLWVLSFLPVVSTGISTPSRFAAVFFIPFIPGDPPLFPLRCVMTLSSRSGWDSSFLSSSRLLSSILSIPSSSRVIRPAASIATSDLDMSLLFAFSRSIMSCCVVGCGIAVFVGAPCRRCLCLTLPCLNHCRHCGAGPKPPPRGLIPMRNIGYTVTS